MTDLELNVAVAKALGLTHEVINDNVVCANRVPYHMTSFRPATSFDDAMWAAEKAGVDIQIGRLYGRWSVSFASASCQTEFDGVPREVCKMILHAAGFVTLENVAATTDAPLLPSRLVKWTMYDPKDAPVSESRVREIIMEELAAAEQRMKSRAAIDDALIKSDGTLHRSACLCPICTLNEGLAVVNQAGPQTVIGIGMGNIGSRADSFVPIIANEHIGTDKLESLMNRLREKSGKQEWTQFPPDTKPIDAINKTLEPLIGKQPPVAERGLPPIPDYAGFFTTPAPE